MDTSVPIFIKQNSDSKPNTMTIIEMSDVLQKEDPNELFKLHLAWVSTLIPFWREAVIRIAELTDTPTDRRDKHLRAIEQSMTLMSAWRFKQIPFIKARQREIDSAISFIRNAALTTKVSKYAFAPVCRNLAGILRSTLRISVFSYYDEQIPEILAHDIFDLATCHTLFPFDTDDFVFFLSSEEPTQTDRSPGEICHLKMNRAGEVLGIRPLIEAVDQQINLIWDNYSAPFAWGYDETVWTQEIPPLSKYLYYITLRAFHQR